MRPVIKVFHEVIAVALAKRVTIFFLPGQLFLILYHSVAQ